MKRELQKGTTDIKKRKKIWKSGSNIEVMISIDNLQKHIAAGEDSTCQFKADVRNAESLASEMAVSTNSDGGRLFIGVADDGSIPRLTGKDVSRINQLVSNAASHLVRNPLMSGKVSGKTSGKIVELMKENAFITLP